MKRLIVIIICLCFLTVVTDSLASKTDVYVANRNAGKVVALTFDDGPHIEYTPKILEILKKYNARATFFVIGKNAKEHPEIVKRTFLEGHEIGNHTYSHPKMNSISSDKVIDEIQKTNEIIRSITGQCPVLFRSPGGYLDDGIINVIEKNDCVPVLWSWRQDTRDWAKPSVNSVVNTVLDNLRDGDIILFHDFNTKGSPTPAALEIILPKLIERGYSLVTVSELMNMQT